MAASPPKERYIPNGLKFAFGGAAGMAATCVVQPLDLIKTRMQLSGGGKSSFAVAGEIIAREGFLKLYAGLSAGLLRQATYTTTRLGVYNYLFDSYRERNQGANPGFMTKTLLGVGAGSIGAFVGTPAEVALIRMTADGRLPKEQRRNYRNVANALMSAWVRLLLVAEQVGVDHDVLFSDVAGVVCRLSVSGTSSRGASSWSAVQMRRCQAPPWFVAPGAMICRSVFCA
ncbi:mitochondrial carrier protein domain-containing protein [Phthorimaea operculella]|nr:mitochondrial carrier protein domain-containing protein [Phthorimaea operculella]